MAYIMSFQERLDCNRSYASEDVPELQCEVGCKCDGTVHECCTWDRPELGYLYYCSLPKEERLALHGIGG